VTFAATAMDNCSATITYSPASGSTFALGTTTVTATATDPAGRIATCTFRVTVTDIQAPAITCPANLTLSTTTGLCGRVLTFATPAATDNCPGVTVAQISGPVSGSTFPVGVTSVSFRATDAAGNTTTCAFTVTVNDLQNPVVTCPASITVNTDQGQCGAVVTFAATATDNCSATLTYSPAPGSFFNLGATTVRVTATDASGRTSTCSFLVTVVDNQSPTIACPSNITVNTAPGLCSAPVTFAATATDNCSATITYSPTSGATFNKGTTLVTATARDGAGRTATCTFTVTVVDAQAPTITCPANRTVNVAAGACSATVTFSPATVTDNCTGTTIAYSRVSGSVFTLGTTTVTATATDASGNTTTCSFSITVVDNILPTITCPANVTANMDAGQCFATVTYAAAATDNCSATVSFSPASGSIFSVGATTVTATATDGAGNTTTCTFRVTVLDNQAPVVSCPSNLSVTIPNGECSTAVTYEASATDNCSATVTYSPASGSVLTAGVTTVTATATDASGNTATCTFTVTVNNGDNVPPTINCPGLVYGTLLPGATSGTATFAATAADACSVTLAYSHASGSTFPVGNTTVTVTATDGAGNTSTCAFTVSIPRYIYVDQTATTGLNNGSNWRHAFLTVQQAITASVSNRDTILVAAGNYSPGAVATAVYTLKARVPMYGGFENGLDPANWSWADRDVPNNTTILNGNNLCRRILSATNLGSDPVMSVFDGFTVQGALGTSVAGGFFITATGATGVCGPVVRNCTFQNNVGLTGGAVGISGATGAQVNPSFTDCSFTGNTATSMGGAVYITAASASVVNVTLTNCTFANNTAFNVGNIVAKGGAVANAPLGAGSRINLTVNNNLFMNNTSEEDGAGIWNYARTTSIINVTVNGGEFVGNSARHGAAIHNWAQGATSTVVVNGAMFNNNAAMSIGGAVRNYSELTNGVGTVTLENCQFMANEANLHGGALGNMSASNGVSTLNVRRCYFTENMATSNGGVVYTTSSTRNATNPLTASTTNIENSVFFANLAMGLGGVLHNEGLTGAYSTLNVTNSTLASNTSAGGAAINNTAVSPALARANFTNCILWNNTFTTPGSALFNNVGTGAVVALRNSSLQELVFAANEVGTGVFDNLGGMISGDPLFVNLALGDLHLESFSPCVDAGTTVSLTVDFDGNARPQGNGFDMGAFESAPVARPMARQPETVVDALDATVFPNPTTGSFTLSLDREVTGFVQVFDLQGRLVASESLNGTNQAQFNLSSESSGIYLVRIVDGETVITKQVVVTRP
jgi:hypothetical protein